MAKKKSKKASSAVFQVNHEVLGLVFVAVAVFYYLCIFSFEPLDPSFFSLATHSRIQNSGGMIGAYLSGFMFFVMGGASYVFGLYFLLNGILLITKNREHLRWLDFVVFLVCCVFISIFLQLQVSEMKFGAMSVNAGGNLGQILGQVGERFLGRLGVYLLVVFGFLVSFIFVTKLSLMEALSLSQSFLGKFYEALSSRLVVILARMQKWSSAYKESKKVKASSIQKQIVDKAEEEEEEEPSIKVNLRKMPLEEIQAANDDDEYEEDDEEYEDDEDEYEYEDDDEEYEDDDEEYEDDEDEEDEDYEYDEDEYEDAPIEPRILERKDKNLAKINEQMELKNISEDYQLPSVGLLDYDEGERLEVDEDSLKMSAKILESKLKDFSIDGRVTEIHPGPVITMYEFQPAPGVKLSKINSLTDDLSLAMGGRPVRIVSPLPNKAAIGIEIPNFERETVWLKDVIGDSQFQKGDSPMKLALGKDIEGRPYVADLQKMPHLLVAGSTGSGKSVSINTMITSILYNARPDEVRMIMIDPKMIELSIYEGIPHLMLPVVTDPKKANLSLKWAVREMERRYLLLADVNARNIAGYNKKIEAGEYTNREPMPDDDNPIFHSGKLPYIVIVIDEFADLMMVSSKEVEESVCRLAQKARASGIHVVIATQRPSVDVITGIIKANFPSRIAFRVTSKHDSRTILDGVGAEHLLGMGDMLFVPPGSSRKVRLHGAYISENEITRIVDFLKEQAKPVYNEEILKPVDETIGASGEDFDEYYDEAVRKVCESGKVSISSIQRQFRIGYNRAARIVEDMESQGVVSSPNGQGQRQVLANKH